MAEKLTNEQQAAVDSRERSLLVSAAAGSGKTKVLVERLFSYVEREGANLDDFLIITYTRRGERALRGKIAKALTERMERDPATTTCGSRCCASTVRTSRRWTRSAPRFCAKTAICSARTRAATRCGPISACWTRTRRRCCASACSRARWTIFTTV
ncbi:MAG: UvrD-helicase domain-containing protein [Oscillibacter sp.]